MSFREDYLVQQVKNSKPNSMDSFIRGRNTILEDFITLLTNICVACMCLARLQLKSNHNPLIGYFSKQMEAAVTLPEFKSWHMKNQANFYWSSHARITSLQPVFALLSSISSNFDDQELLKLGDNPPH